MTISHLFFKCDIAIPTNISKTYDKLKKNIATRLAHKTPYQLIERTPENELDLLIVVDKMLTGFDSKWINTLYLDKKLRFEKIIQISKLLSTPNLKWV